MKKACCAVLLSVLCLCMAATSAFAKDFETVHADMLKAMLAKNSGKVILLNFFATWCPPCQEEIPALVKASQKYKGKKVVFIGLSVDDPKAKASVAKFIDKYAIPYPVYMAGKDLIAMYKIGSIPHNVFYEPGGNMIISQPGKCDVEDIQLVVDDLLQGN